MDFEVSYTFENEQQFWMELDEIVSVQSQEHEIIDNALRSYFAITETSKDEYVQTEYDIARCSYRLLHSNLFASAKDYVRRQIVYSLLQEDSPATLQFITAFLIYDGRENETTFEMMNEEGAFPRLVELIQQKRDGDAGLHRMLLELLYEMSRIQRLRAPDLISVDDDFISYMFQIIESLSDDVADPYHYPVIRVLLILNEQYMVSAHGSVPDQPQASAATPTNRVIKILAADGPTYKSFGQNIILLLNRESETSLQLLILKLLYLLFTSPPTYEYFYTNDLHVLLDIIVRNLLDLPPASSALRHTYLRVLYPLLAHTQLRHPPHYKRDDVVRLLAVMSGSSMGHFGAVDETTKRLTSRCSRVSWLCEEAQETRQDGEDAMKRKQSHLGVGDNSAAMASSLSVIQVAEQRSKPGIRTPSRVKDASKALESEAKPTKDEVKSPFEVEGEAGEAPPCNSKPTTTETRLYPEKYI